MRCDGTVDDDVVIGVSGDSVVVSSRKAQGRKRFRLQSDSVDELWLKPELRPRENLFKLGEDRFAQDQLEGALNGSL